MDELFKQGAYWCEVTDYGMAEAKSGAEQTRVNFLVKGPVNASDPSLFDQLDIEFERKFYQVVSSKTVKAGMVQKVFDAIGFAGTFTQFAEDEACKGTFIQMYCKHEEYPKGSGIIVERWQLSRGEGRLSSEKTSRLDTMFGSQMAKTTPTAEKEAAPAVESPKTKPAKSASVPSGSTSKEDDGIPF